MKTPRPNLELKEQPIEEVQGFIPLAFEDTPVLAPGASFTMFAQYEIGLKGPYLFRFTNPSGVRVSHIKCGTYALEGNNLGLDAETLIANTETSQLGDQFFPIDGPTLYVGNRFTVTVVNTSGTERKISLTIYARRATPIA